MSIFDVAIVGAGLAGSFAALRLSHNKNVKTILFDLGRPPGKRRRQLEGWFGVFPNSDGKFYLNDVDNVGNIVGPRKAKSSATWVNNYFTKHVDFKVHEDRKPYAPLEKRIQKNGFDFHLNDYIQFYPKDIHVVSKNIATELEDSGRVQFSFDNEVYKIHKQKGVFSIQTAQGEFLAKKVLIAVGRSGWRWATDIFNHFDIVENNDYATFGIHAEISASYMKEFNKSNCTISNNELSIGPFSWNGTIIPEDHVDLTISAFRSNENRWKSDKVSFKIIGRRYFENNGFEQTSRLGKLAFVLANDRLSKEKVSAIVGKRSKISVLPEYDWLVESCEQITNVIPEFMTKGYFQVPTIQPLPPKIAIGTNLETEVDDLFVAGESTGLTGLLAAAVTGSVVADNILK